MGTNTSLVSGIILVSLSCTLASSGSALTVVSQTDGSQPTVAALPAYANEWLEPRVNLWSGNLVVRHHLVCGAFANLTSPVADPAVDLPFGSSPAAVSLTGPAQEIQAFSRIPLLSEVHVALIYNATMVPTDATLGAAGWRHSYQVTLDSSGAVNQAVNWGDGRRDLLVRKIVGADTSWTGAAGLEARTLVRVGAMRELRALHGGAYVFDLAGQLVSIRDRTGVSVAVVWNSGRVIQVVGPFSQLDFGYDGTGRLGAVSDGVRPNTTLQYDGDGRLSVVTDPAGASVQYSYDAYGRLSRIIEQDGDAITIAYHEPMPVVRRVEMVGSLRMFSYDVGTHTTRVNDALDDATTRTTAYTFDAAGRCTGVLDGSDPYSSSYDSTTSRRTGYMDARGYQVTARYDAFGDLTSVADSYGNRDSVALDGPFHLASLLRDPTGVAWSITRDPSNGNPTQMTNALGQTTRWFWESAGCPGCGTRLGMQLGARNDSTRYFYDSHGNATTIVDPGNVPHMLGYDNLGRLIAVDDPRGTVPQTLLTYTHRDEVASLIQPGGRTTHYVWRLTGQLLSAQQPSGATSQYEYNASNQVTKSTSPLGHATVFALDRAGRVTRVTDPLGHATDYSRDAQGQLLSTTTANGATWFTSWSGGLPASSTDPTGRTVTLAFDERGLLTQKSSLGVTNTYTYDNAARMTSASADDGDTVVTHAYVYDEVGQLVGHQQTGIALDTHYDLDAGGLPIRLWDSGRVDSVRFRYDKRALPTYVSAPVSGADFTADMTRNSIAALASVTYNTGVTSAFSYDSLARLALITHVGNGWNASYALGYNPDGRTSYLSADHPGLGPLNLDLLLDGDARLTGERYAPGRDFGYAYDAAGRRTLKSSPYAYDAYAYTVDDKLLRAGDTRLTWDAAGRCTFMASPSDTLRFVYRSDGALMTIKRNGPSYGSAISGTWRAMIGPFGELAGWVLPDGRRFWMGYDEQAPGAAASGWRRGLLRRSTSLMHSSTQARDDYLYSPGDDRLLMWGLRGGTFVGSRRRPMLSGPFGSVTEIGADAGDGAAVGALAWKRLYGAFGESADPSFGETRAPLQGYSGMDIVPVDNGAGSTLPGIPDSTLLVDWTDASLYATGLGMKLVAGDSDGWRWPIPWRRDEEGEGDQLARMLQLWGLRSIGNDAYGMKEGPGWYGDKQGPGWYGHKEGPSWYGHKEAPSWYGHKEGPSWYGHKEGPSWYGHKEAPSWYGHKEGPSWKGGPGWYGDKMGPSGSGKPLVEASRIFVF